MSTCDAVKKMGSMMSLLLLDDLSFDKKNFSGDLVTSWMATS
jgi:hypothetical protein